MPLGVLEESTQIVRENIFSMSDRKKIPSLIYQVLENELQAEREALEAEGAGDGAPKPDSLKTLVEKKFD